MTWSVVARDPASGAFGIAIASRFFAVGALCPHAQSAVGALSTQALVNPHYGKQAIELLRQGVAAPAIVQQLIAPDEGRDHRQIHVIDGAGRIGQHTGAACVAWCGAVAGDGFSVAGNMLAGAAVLQETARVYQANADLEFARRLIEALAAGEAAGGDKRGKQSAALLVCSGEDYPALSIRVDDHAEPIGELRRLYQVAHERFVPFMQCAPRKAEPWGTTDREKIERHIADYEKSRPRAS